MNFQIQSIAETKRSLREIYLDLLASLKKTVASQQMTLFQSIERLTMDYFQLWDLRHDYRTSFLPIASRSSFAPHPSSPHRCAVFTITYNDIEMLRIWIRYFTRHFPAQDVYVLNHHSSAVQDPVRTALYETTLKELEKKYGMRIIDLYGEKTGFPMMFFISTADLFQRRLYRYGYQCAILTDTDEMIIADPDPYPEGLKQYLTSFAKDETKTVIRSHGYILGQLSTIIPAAAGRGGGKVARRIDPPLDWEKSLLPQRQYWAVQPKYSKPVLSRLPVRHYPGFHNVYYPKPVKLDPKLMLIHLRDMDAQFCQQREYMKAMIVQNTSFQSELQKGLSTHLVHYQEKLAKGEVCQYSFCKFFQQNNTVYDQTMEFTMKLIPPRFKKNVEI